MHAGKTDLSPIGWLPNWAGNWYVSFGSSETTTPATGDGSPR
jgi:hypothetical protein